MQKGNAGVTAAGRPSRLLVSLLLLLSTAGAAQEDDHDDDGGGNIDLDVTAFYDSNVTLAELDDDIADDAGIEVSVTWSRTEEGLQGRASGWSLAVRDTKFDEFDDLNQIELEAGAKYIAQFRRGFSAPVYEFSVTAKVIDSVSDLRDSWQVELGALMTRRLTDRLVGRLGTRLTRRRADDFDAFDNDRINLFANGDLRVSQRNVLYGTYIVSVGDVVSTAVPTLKIVNAAEVIEPDDAFGGIPANRFAYRLDAVVHIVTVGWNHSLGPNRSLDLSAQGLAARADGDNDYERGAVRFSYLHRF